MLEYNPRLSIHRHIHSEPGQSTLYTHSLLQSSLFQNVSPLWCSRRNLPTIPPLPSLLPNRHNRHDGKVHQRDNKQQCHTPKHPNWNNQRGKSNSPPIHNSILPSTHHSLIKILNPTNNPNHRPALQQSTASSPQSCTQTTSSHSYPAQCLTRCY